MFSQPLLTAGEVARICNLSPKTIFKLVATGTLRSIKLGRALRFDPDKRYGPPHRLQPVWLSPRDTSPAVFVNCLGPNSLLRRLAKRQPTVTPVTGKPSISGRLNRQSSDADLLFGPWNPGASLGLCRKTRTNETAACV